MSVSSANQNVADLISGAHPSISFEFFPPKTPAGVDTLWQAITDLEPLNPTFVSVTYGAGGSTRERTVEITGRIGRETSMRPVGHLTCVGATREQLDRVLDEYSAAGVSNVLVLRGDPPAGPGAPWTPTDGGFDYASQLVEFTADKGEHCIGVAAFPDPHPASGSAEIDAAVLKAKQDAGAQFAITQFFFRSKSYFELVQRATEAGVTIPIIPGIMPVTNLAQIERFAQLSGADFPADLRAEFDEVDEEGVRELGIEHATDLCRELLEGGAPGLHFYTLNRSSATREIFRDLGLSPAGAKP